MTNRRTTNDDPDGPSAPSIAATYLATLVALKVGDRWIPAAAYSGSVK